MTRPLTPGASRETLHAELARERAERIAELEAVLWLVFARIEADEERGGWSATFAYEEVGAIRELIDADYRRQVDAVRAEKAPEGDNR